MTRLTDHDVVEAIREFGGENGVFDLFVAAGPILVLAIAVFGRTPVTTALAATYLAAFTLYVAWRWILGD